MDQAISVPPPMTRSRWTTCRPSFRAVGVEPIGGTPAAMATFVKEESQRWGDVIRKSNIVLE
jgi:hypothetical protein